MRHPAYGLAGASSLLLVTDTIHIVIGLGPLHERCFVGLLETAGDAMAYVRTNGRIALVNAQTLSMRRN
jgi:hypothetical protein